VSTPIRRPSRPEDQHFVPAGYLRGFLPDGERALSVRRRDGARWFTQRPENIATRKNFYSILREDGNCDDVIEHILACDLEGPGLRALRGLKEGEAIPSIADRERISALLSVQYVRIPEMRNNVHDAIENATDAFTREMLRDTEGLASEVQRMESVDRATAVRSVRRWKRLYESGDIFLRVRKEASLSLIFASVEQGTAVFSDMDWVVYTSRQPAFFTSDRPVYISPPSIAGHGNVGMAIPGVVVHAPLSSRRFLIMSRLGHSRQMLYELHEVLDSAFVTTLSSLPPVVVYKEASAAMIRELNQQTAQCAGDWLCGPFESRDVEDALIGLPRISTRFHITAANEGLRLDHRIVIGSS
jgi:hypothetical protein